MSSLLSLHHSRFHRKPAQPSEDFRTLSGRFFPIIVICCSLVGVYCGVLISYSGSLKKEDPTRFGSICMPDRNDLPARRVHGWVLLTAFSSMYPKHMPTTYGAWFGLLSATMSS